MVATDRKLDALTSVLTPRQRAIVSLRAWAAGEQPDERLHRLCPPQDLAEFQGIGRAVERGNNELAATTAYLLEWVAQVESEIHWLRTLEMYQRREREIPAAIRKGLPALLPVWETKRQTHRAYGRAGEEEPAPKNWDEFTAAFVRDLRKGIGLRWQDYLQGEAALREASDALGIDVTHHSVREIFSHLKEDTLRLVRMMAEAGHPVDLPEFDATIESYAKGAFKLEVLREVPEEKHAREWLMGQARADLETWEREQAALFEDE